MVQEQEVEEEEGRYPLKHALRESCKKKGNIRLVRLWLFLSQVALIAGTGRALCLVCIHFKTMDASIAEPLPQSDEGILLCFTAKNEAVLNC